MGKPDIRKWITFALQFLPLVLAAKGVPDAIIEPLVKASVEAEGFPGATGLEKKAHVMEIARDTIAVVNETAGKQTINPTRVIGLVSDGIDLGVRVVELVHDHTVEANQLNHPHPDTGLESLPPSSQTTQEPQPNTAPPDPTTQQDAPPVPPVPPAATGKDATGKAKVAESTRTSKKPSKK